LQGHEKGEGQREWSTLEGHEAREGQGEWLTLEGEWWNLERSGLKLQETESEKLESREVREG
jgi:hypothetical protein